MTQGVQVDLPKTDSENLEVNKYIQVSVNKRHNIFINQEPVTIGAFPSRFKEIFAGQVGVPVFISGDKRVNYGLMVRLISEIQNAGAVKLGFLSEPVGEMK